MDDAMQTEDARQETTDAALAYRQGMRWPPRRLPTHALADPAGRRTQLPLVRRITCDGPPHDPQPSSFHRVSNHSSRNTNHGLPT